IRLLRKRGTREIFDAATRLLASPCAVERELGANIHEQLGWEQDKPFAAESVQLLMQLLEMETDLNVIYATVFAFYHLYRPECIPTLIRFATHPDPDIRYAVACALSRPDDECVIDTLIALTNDEDDRVRDWATFSFVLQEEWDSPAIRAALWAR